MLNVSVPSEMPPHSYLYGILVSLTSSVNYITTYAPTPNGYLKRKLNYIFSFRDFEEFRKENLCIPDGLIINENKKILIIPECKTGVTDEKDSEPRIQNQILSYCSKKFHRILGKLVDYDEYEIVIFTYTHSVKGLIQQLQSIETNECNLIVWSLEEGNVTDEVRIRKVYGKHIDSELNQEMSLGVSCEPPAREFIDPDMPAPRIAFILGCRLLNTFGESLLKKNMIVKPLEFCKGNLDLVFSETKLRHFFRVLTKLIPDLCTYDRKTGNVKIKTRLDPEKISLRLLEISSMSNEEYRHSLGLPIKEEQFRKIEKEIAEVLKPKRTPTLEEIMWSEDT